MVKITYQMQKLPNFTQKRKIAKKKKKRDNDFLSFFFRFIVTTVSLEATETGDKLHLEQIAEKDHIFRNDSTVDWEVNGDILTMKIMVKTKEGEVHGCRKFVRHQPKNPLVTKDRKMSAPF